MTGVLFVCMGNICRSPTVEAVARTEFARAGIEAHVESAGTESYHVGQGADPRAIRVAAAHGYSLAEHRARQVRRSDFVEFDHVFAMDRANLRALQHFRPEREGVEPALFLRDDELPDPYFGSDSDFERVIVLARRGVEALMERLRSKPLEH